MEVSRLILEEIISIFPELTLMNILVIILLTIVAFLVYYYVVLPMDWTKDLSQVGFGYLKTKDRINLVRRQRKVGNLPPIYPNGWFVLVEGDDLKKGQAVHVTALGENYVVFRSTTDGQAHVLDAYCPHLGANLGVGGTVRGDCIECPFHGWKFRGSDGQCVDVPYGKVPDFAKVKTYTSCEVNRLIFIWHHAEGADPNWYPESRENIEKGEWAYRGRNEFLINSHIQEIPENGGDVAHLNVLHATSALSGSDLRKTAPPVGSWQPAIHVWKAAWEPCTEINHKHESKLDLMHSVCMFNSFNVITMDIKARQIGPGYVVLDLFTSYGKMTILQYVTPLEPLLQKVVHRIYCPWYLSLIAPLVLIGESVMIERDIMVWNSKKYLDKPLLVKEDKALAKHRRWYNQFYSANSPRMTFAKDTLEF